MLLSAWDVMWGAIQAVQRHTLVVKGRKISLSSKAVRDGKYSDLSGAISVFTGLWTYPSSSLESNPGFTC